jgi:two-component system cell cycle sensor histidine kinase/response regulator CckA
VRFARFFNSSPLAIATLDPGSHIQGSNPSFLKLFGASAGTGRGGAASALDLVAPPDRARLEAALAAAASGESGALDVTLAREGGRSARLWISAVTDGDSALGERAILYALDTTEQRLLEQQFVQAQKMQAIGQLAGGVAHDFNNVLQAIIGYSDLLLASHRPTDPSFQDLMQIKQNANRAASLVRQLLAFSRRQTLRPETVKLGETLSDLSLLLKRLLGERVQLEMRQGRDLWFVKADVNQLEQVIINLAVNARDAMPDGGTVTIGTENVAEAEARRRELAGMPAADYVRIEVSDTGTGHRARHSRQDLRAVLHNEGARQGNGPRPLDRVRHREAVRRLHLCRFDAWPGHQLLHLPAPLRAGARGGEKPDLKEEKRAADMTGQGTVLLVEDEDAVRAVNCRALSARGYTVLEAASGIEALEIVDAHEGTIDLVVSDVVMPEMDGPTLLGELRKRRSDLKIIFVSGYAEDAFAKHLPEGETFSFLAKPFSLKQLVETVKGAIQR